MHEQDDLNLHILCMLKGNFSLDMAIIISDTERFSKWAMKA